MYLSSLPLFVKEIKVLSSASLFSLLKFEVLKLGIPIATGMTDFILYTIEYGVSPRGILLVVWEAYNMLGRSSAHLLLDFSNLAFRFLKIILLVTSTCSFA